jgi:ADP-ribosylglycohydrolase
MKNKVLDALIGMAVGDALGVPVEFLSRELLKGSPVVEMVGYGTHNQPAGTWSDDSSLAFCLAESLCEGYDINKIAKIFLRWYQEDHWTPHGRVFDIGVATSQALRRVRDGVNPLVAGGVTEYDNGNGSLMRILPLAFYIQHKSIDERFKLISEVSSITHGHIRSILSCFIYIEYVLELLKGIDKMEAFKNMQKTVNVFFKEYQICSEEELHKFHRILENPIGDYNIYPIYEYPEHEIRSSGYVLHTLEASFWCFLKSMNYAEAVQKAVNLGEDTDTTGCVTGGLAGLYYGLESIPAHWIEVLARKNDIFSLAEKLFKVTQK